MIFNESLIIVVMLTYDITVPRVNASQFFLVTVKLQDHPNQRTVSKPKIDYLKFYRYSLIFDLIKLETEVLNVMK